MPGEIRRAHLSSQTAPSKGERPCRATIVTRARGVVEFAARQPAMVLRMVALARPNTPAPWRHGANSAQRACLLMRSPSPDTGHLARPATHPVPIDHPLRRTRDRLEAATKEARLPLSHCLDLSQCGGPLGAWRRCGSLGYSGNRPQKQQAMRCSAGAPAASLAPTEGGHSEL